MEAIVEIIKFTAPAFVVFLTVWFLIKEYNNKEFALRREDTQRKIREVTLPLRLQAYERMAIFLERITLTKLLLRLRTSEGISRDLSTAIMVAVEQEFDHNLAQQIYMSPELWQIIQIAKNEAITIAGRVGKDLPEGANSDDYTKALFNHLDQNPQQGCMQAQLAIKKEVQLYL